MFYEALAHLGKKCRKSSYFASVKLLNKAPFSLMMYKQEAQVPILATFLKWNLKTLSRTNTYYYGYTCI